MDVGTTPITDELFALRARVKQLESLLQNSELRNAKLDYRLRDLLDRLYGPKGDTLNPAQKLLFGLIDTDELPTPPSESEKKADTATSKKKKGGGRLPKPDNLPVVRKVIDLPEDQKAGLVWMRDEITKQLEFQPRRFYMLHTVRPMYASPTRAHAPIVAALPPQVIPHAGVGVGFITHVVVSRFVDHLPSVRDTKIPPLMGPKIPPPAGAWARHSRDAWRPRAASSFCLRSEACARGGTSDQATARR
jgi:transposase